MSTSESSSPAPPPPAAVEGDEEDYWADAQSREVKRAISHMEKAPLPKTDPDE